MNWSSFWLFVLYERIACGPNGAQSVYFNSLYYTPFGECMRAGEHFWFYAPPFEGEQSRLPQPELHHATGVLRAQAGTVLRITDGRGAVYQAELLDREGTFRVLSRECYKRPRPLVHVAAGLPDRACFEELIAMTVPFGVSCITPLICSHSQKPWWKSAWSKHAERFAKLSIVSLKQAHSPYAPVIETPMDFSEFVRKAAMPLFFADMRGSPLAAMRDPIREAERICCMVGPPGGFSNDEIAELERKEARPLWLGHYRLRTELAASAIVAAVYQTCADDTAR